MNPTLYLSALKLSRTAIITWATILLLYSLMVTYFYDSIKDISAMQETMESLPEGMKQIIGTADLEFDAFAGGIYDVRVYFNTEYLSWLPLMLAIYAVFYCGGIVSREAERRTLDLLLTQPLARYRLLLSKLATFVSIVGVLLAVSWIGTVVGLALVGASIDLHKLVLAHLMILPLLLSVGAYCAVVSCVYLDPRRSLAVAGVITAVMYLLNMFGPLMGDFQWLENLSLFHHINTLDILLETSIDWVGLAVQLSVAAAAIALALVVFERRDLSY